MILLTRKGRVFRCNIYLSKWLGFKEWGNIIRFRTFGFYYNINDKVSGK